MKPIKLFKNNNSAISKERIQLISGCYMMKNKLSDLYSILDYTTENDLIDSVIYEIKAANMRYHYYLKLCKERGYTA